MDTRPITAWAYAPFDAAPRWATTDPLAMPRSSVPSVDDALARARGRWGPSRVGRVAVSGDWGGGARGAGAFTRGLAWTALGPHAEQDALRTAWRALAADLLDAVFIEVGQQTPAQLLLERAGAAPVRLSSQPREVSDLTYESRGSTSVRAVALAAAALDLGLPRDSHGIEPACIRLEVGRATWTVEARP